MTKYRGFFMKGSFMLKPLMVVIGLSSAMVANATEQHDVEQFKLKLNSFSYSNIAPISQIIDDNWRKKPNNNASNAFTHNELSFSYTKNNLQLSIRKRLSAVVKTNTATSELYYASQQEDPTLLIDDANINLQLTTQESTGLMAGYRLDLSDLSLGLELGYWRIDDRRDSVLTGNVSLIAGQYIGQLSMSELYSDNNFLKRPHLGDFKRTGDGITANVSANWQINPTLNINLTVDDIYAKYKINEHGYSEGSLNTDNTLINDKGFETFLPFYSGFEKTKDHRFDSDPKSKLTLSYLSELGTLTMQASRLYNTNFVEIGYQWSLNNYQIITSFDVERLTPSIAIRDQDWHLAFGMDKLDIDDAQTLRLNLSYRW